MKEKIILDAMVICSFNTLMEEVGKVLYMVKDKLRARNTVICYVYADEFTDKYSYSVYKKGDKLSYFEYRFR